jgi:hypothetical protein
VGQIELGGLGHGDGKRALNRYSAAIHAKLSAKEPDKPTQICHKKTQNLASKPGPQGANLSAVGPAKADGRAKYVRMSANIFLRLFVAKTLGI